VRTITEVKARLEHLLDKLEKKYDYQTERLFLDTICYANNLYNTDFWKYYAQRYSEIVYIKGGFK